MPGKNGIPGRDGNDGMPGRDGEQSVIVVTPMRTPFYPHYPEPGHLESPAISNGGPLPLADIAQLFNRNEYMK